MMKLMKECGKRTHKVTSTKCVDWLRPVLKRVLVCLFFVFLHCAPLSFLFEHPFTSLCSLLSSTLIFYLLFHTHTSILVNQSKYLGEHLAWLPHPLCSSSSLVIPNIFPLLVLIRVNSTSPHKHCAVFVCDPEQSTCFFPFLVCRKHFPALLRIVRAVSPSLVQGGTHISR